MDDATAWLGQRVTICVDRPLGSAHPRFPETFYTVNYGFVPDTESGDGEPLDAYVLGIDEPLEQFTGRCVAVLRRLHEDDDKLILVPDGFDPDDAAIRRATAFQERYFESEILRGI